MHSRCLEQDKKIIDLIRKNDQAGFNLFYDRYAGILYGVILRWVNDVPLAEELLFATFVKVFSEIKTYRPETSSFFTWMMGISRSLAKDHIFAYSNTAECKNNQDVFDLIINKGLSVQTTADVLCKQKKECVSLLKAELKKLTTDPH